MAEEVRRQVVSDPLAQGARGQSPDRSLPVPGVRGVSAGPGNERFQQAMSGLAAMGNIQNAVAKVIASKKDEAVAQGKLDYMSGVTEQEMLRTGNKYNKQGYETLSAVDKGSQWYMNESLAIEETGRDMEPEQYKAYLMEKRKQALADLPADPAVRKVYAATFEEYGPRLIQEQFKAYNERNRVKNISALSDAAYSSAGVNEDASRVMPGGPLRVSPGIVSPKIEYSDEDRDIGIRTMLGEAGGEGELGMAAVAHVLKNRAIDGGYGGRSIKSVSLAPKQFSAWNTGPGGIPAIRNYSPTSKAYQRAAKVYDAVMSGHHADPTGGATHYFSPKGMDLLVAQGAQSNRVPRWWNDQAAKGSVTIGNHKFAGKARGLDDFIGREPLAEPSDDMTAEVDYFGSVPDKRAGTPGMPGNAYDPSVMIATPLDAPSDVVAETGVALKHTPGKSQLRQTFESANMRDEDKADAATDAMIRSLEDGNDQVYNDLGGEAFLRDLHATDAQINAVQTAHANMQKKANDKFDVDRERKTQDFKSAVSAGEFSSEQEVLEAVDALQDEVAGDEQWAKSLAKEVLTEYNKKTADNKALNPDLASDLAGIQRMQAEDPTYTPEDASTDLVALGAKYGIDGKTTQGWITQMWQRDNSRREKLRNEMAAEQKRVAEQEKTKQLVITALKTDSGLLGISGQVEITDDNGNVRKVNAQEYGIHLLKQEELANAQAAIATGKVSPQVAEANFNKTVYEKLAKQGVVDKEHGQEIEGALHGDILNKDGTVSDDAAKAFDFWLQMKKNPNVGDAYMAQMVTNPDVRVLLNAAEDMYAGRMDIQGALRKAQLRISQGFNLDERIKYNDKFEAQVGAGVDEALLTIMPTGRATLAGPTWAGFDRLQAESNRDKYREDIKNRANGYHIQNPQVDPSVHIKMAIEDFKNDGIVLTGNLVSGKYTDGKRLDQVMGIESYGRDAPQKAFDMYMAEFGKDLFPGLLDDTGPTWFGGGERKQGWLSYMADVATLDFSAKRPWYNAEYNSTTGIVEIQLWKNEERTELIGTPQYVNAKELGEYWLESNKDAPFGMEKFREFKETLSNNLINRSAAEAGAMIGSMPSPERFGR